MRNSEALSDAEVNDEDGVETSSQLSAAALVTGVELLSPVLQVTCPTGRPHQQ